MVVANLRESVLFVLAGVVALAACTEHRASAPALPDVTEDCAVPGDEDGNGLADCLDPACTAATACQVAILPVCGDGRVDPEEQCDDGNLTDSDGCDNRCQASAVAYLKASNTRFLSWFGNRIAMSADGTTLAVGAPNEYSASAGVDADQADVSYPGAGAVYVFTRDGMTWRQQAYLKASRTWPSDQFGSSLALSADGATLVVGAHFADAYEAGYVAHAGGAYVFTRSGTSWSQQAYIAPPHPSVLDAFGLQVALSGDGATLAISSRDESLATGVDSEPTEELALDVGAVYVFVRRDGSWAQQAYIKASNAGENDVFGFDIALSGDGSVLAVGAPGESSATAGVDGDQTDDSAQSAGAAYVFLRSGTTWAQQAYLKPSTATARVSFGAAIALSTDGATLVIGAPYENSAATGVDGDQADRSAFESGAAYVFIRDAQTWSQAAYVKASNTARQDRFGRSIALSGDGETLVVGAPLADAAPRTDGASDASLAADTGAVYRFMRAGTSWRQVAYLKAPNADKGDELGDSVAVSADGALVATGAAHERSAARGAGGDQSDNSAVAAGAVYIFASGAGTVGDRPTLTSE